jgi:hypothetical protein
MHFIFCGGLSWHIRNRTLVKKVRQISNKPPNTQPGRKLVAVIKIHKPNNPRRKTISNTVAENTNANGFSEAVFSETIRTSKMAARPVPGKEADALPLCIF